MWVLKADQAQQIVYGWAGQYMTADGKPIEDLQGDVLEPEDIQKAAEQFVLNYGESGIHHEGKSVGKIVASLVTTNDIVKAFFPDSLGRVPVGWIIGVYYPDKKVFDRVVSGELPMFSVQGNADRFPDDGQQAP